MNTSPKFVSASELARLAGCSVGKITAAVEAGLLQPAGRAGNHKTAAMIFMRDDLDNLLTALRLGGQARAVASIPRPAHQCRDTDEVRAKAQALQHARQEVSR